MKNILQNRNTHSEKKFQLVGIIEWTAKNVLLIQSVSSGRASCYQWYEFNSIVFCLKFLLRYFYLNLVVKGITIKDIAPAIKVHQAKWAANRSFTVSNHYTRICRFDNDIEQISTFYFFHSLLSTVFSLNWEFNVKPKFIILIGNRNNKPSNLRKKKIFTFDISNSFRPIRMIIRFPLLLKFKNKTIEHTNFMMRRCTCWNGSAVFFSLQHKSEYIILKNWF